MSSITNRIATVFTANAGNVRAVMGEVAGGMQNIARASQETGRQSGYANNQLRAMATTLRYALAGSVVFGAAGLVRSLSGLQTQMALMASIGDVVDQSGQRVVLTQQRLRGLLDELQQGSNDALTPVNELASSVVNLLSSVQGVQDRDISKITVGLAQGAQLAQTPVEDLTKAITGMNQAFSRTPSVANFQQLERGFITLTRRAPGGVTAGSQIINQLAPLSAVARLARVSPQQMFGLLTTGLRFGGTPATGARGMQFLLQSIAAPNKAEAGVLAGVGITPDFVQKRGGVAAIRRLIDAAKARGISGAQNLRGLSDEQLDAADTAGMEGLKGLGVSGAGVQFLQRAIGRIHGVRALVALMSQMDTPQGNVFIQDIEAADRAMRGIGTEGEAIKDQFADFRRQQPLRAAAISLHNVAIEVPRALEVILNPLARVVDRAGNFATQHPRGTRIGILAGAGALAAAAVGRHALRGFTSQAFVTERAITAATDPAKAGILGGAPQNPMYVTVVGQLFGAGRGGVGGGTEAATEAGLAKRIAEKFGLPAVGAAAAQFAKGPGLRFGVAAGAAYAASQVAGNFVNRKLGIHGGPTGGDLRHRITGMFDGGDVPGLMQRSLVRQANKRSEEIASLNRTLAPFHRRDPLYGVTAIYSQRRDMIHGKAEVVLDVNLSTEKGLVRKKIHVPMALWSGGRNPGSRGQPGKSKSKVP